MNRKTDMDEIAQRYRDFAAGEAAGRSTLYETLARHVAASPGALAFLRHLPAERQQPNLLFAALRLVAGTPASVAAFDYAICDQAGTIANLMLTHVTQTNEPGRCAALLPVLARIKGPLALIEVGASAGLCLLPDAYGYDWSGHRLEPPAGDGPAAPVFTCDASNDTPLPDQHPEIVWRIGLDLNPLDVSNDEDVAWLEALVWPEHQDRLARLRAAIAVAKARRPLIVAGDLRHDLPGLIAEAPRGATLVVFHTAVLTYLADHRDRDAFAATMIREQGIVWISNEGPRVFPGLAPAAPPPRKGMFLLSVNGLPQAWTEPHGGAMHWISAGDATAGQPARPGSGAGKRAGPQAHRPTDPKDACGPAKAVPPCGKEGGQDD
jgi:hypothetical protein